MSPIVQQLYELYEKKGFLLYDEILEKAASAGVSLIQTERICSELIAMGAMICEDEFDDEDVAFLDSNVIYNIIIEREPILKSFVNYVQRIKRPERNEVEKLYPQIVAGNQYARNRLFEMYMRNALKFAYQQSVDYNLNLADSIQDGMMGLFLAVDKYSPYEHGKFPAYSYFWIKSTIDVRKKIENSLWDIPNNKLIEVENLYKYLKKYIPSYVDNPQLTDSFIKETADKQQLPLEDVKRYLFLLTHPLNIDLVEIEYRDNGFYKLWLKNVIRKIFTALSEKDRGLAELYYDSSLTYSEIAERLDVSRERIRQRFIKIEKKVKKEGSRYFDIDPRITEFNF